MNHSFRKFAALLPLGVIVAGCDAAPEDSSVTPSSSEEALTFATADNGTLEISKSEDGGILVSVVEPAMSKEIRDEFSRGNADLIDLYLGLTGNTEVPEALERMNAQYLENRSLHADAEAKGDPNATSVRAASDPLAPGAIDTVLDLTQTSLTTDQFTSGYCYDPGADYFYCWPSTTGTSYVEGRKFWMMTFAYSYRGTISHRIQRHLWGKWSTKKSNTVPQGYLSSLEYTAGGLQDWIRGGVWDADGDGYHVAIYGIN